MKRKTNSQSVKKNKTPPTKPRRPNKKFASNNLNDANRIFIFGKHPSFQALLNKKRKIYQIFTTKNSTQEVKDFLQKNQLTNYINLIKEVHKDQLTKLIQNEHNHQNIALTASKLNVLKQFNLLELLHQKEKDDLPNILILDQITDPQNVGAIIRSAAAFNYKIIVFSQYNSAQENPIIAKASAGNIEHVQLAIATNINDLLKKLKEIGYWCVALAGEGKDDISKINQFNNKAIIVGSEGKGVRHLVKQNCDLVCKININKDVESLNVASATSIVLYETSK